ncbi:MAG: protein-disulfide reductase DsbD family protein [Candidatus Puniceispirillaceae bacterium]
MNPSQDILPLRSVKPLIGLFALLVVILFPAQPRAAESAWTGDMSIGEARLVSAVSATGELSTLPLGLEFTLAPGWKIYWRTPGEAGLAPVIDLSASPTQGLTGSFRWPLPKRFDAFGFDNFGYENAVVLPFDVTGHVPGAPVRIIADLEALACADICVPLAGRLELDLADGAATPSRHAQALAQFSAMVPRLAGPDGISPSAPSLRIAAAEARDNGLFVELAEDAPEVAELFVEGISDVAFKAPEPMGRGLFMTAVPARDLDIAGQRLTLTLSAPPEFGAFEVVVSAAGGPVAMSADDAALSMRIIALALLGGLVLNLMPCVLPVLALKLSSVLSAVGAPRRRLRLRFLAGAAGIVTSFMLLAGGLAMLRLAGGTVGWGIQFQNPLFLAVMIAMLGIFALSFLDRVTIPVPRFAQTLAGAARGRNGNSYRSDFLAGMLATILATPCSAPFVGTAVAAALSGGMAELFGIFLALGVGLAAPWLLVAAQPSLVGFLPRPGPWMVWMKRGLALLLVGTMIWLGSLLAQVLSPHRPDGMAGENAVWQSWSPEAMADSLAAGTPVLVDVTADWCVTCKANKALVLDRAPVATTLQTAATNGDLVLLRADWTRPDDAIAGLLASHGRFGIPFNLLLTSAGEQAIVLPEILTTGSVMRALENAGVTAK